MKIQIAYDNLRAVTFPVLLGMLTLAALTLIQLRLVSFVVLLLLAGFCALNPRFRYGWGMVAGGTFFIVSLFLPIDVAIGSYYWGHRSGTSPGGPHLVKFVGGGYAKHTYLIQKYGEYINGGCMWPAILPPSWVLVWD